MILVSPLTRCSEFGDLRRSIQVVWKLVATFSALQLRTNLIYVTQWYREMLLKFKSIDDDIKTVETQ